MQLSIVSFEVPLAPLEPDFTVSQQPNVGFVHRSSFRTRLRFSWNKKAMLLEKKFGGMDYKMQHGPVLSNVL
jgi:hypothetical protein